MQMLERTPGCFLGSNLKVKHSHRCSIESQGDMNMITLRASPVALDSPSALPLFPDVIRTLLTCPITTRRISDLGKQRRARLQLLCTLILKVRNRNQ